MDKMKLILDTYEIKHLSKRCNFDGCEKKPTKLVEIVERNNIRKKIIAKIYLCEEHLHTIEELIEKLKKMSKGVIIEMNVTGL